MWSIASRAGFRRDERGTTAIEYGLIAGFVAAVIFAGVAALGGGTSGLWSRIGTAFTTYLG